MRQLVKLIYFGVLIKHRRVWIYNLWNTNKKHGVLDPSPLYNRGAYFSETTHTKSKNNVDIYAQKNVKIAINEIHSGDHFQFTTYTLSLKLALSSFCKTEFQGDTFLFGEND